MARTPQKLEVIQLGNPILRQRATEVDDVHDPRIQNLIDDLLFTCRAYDGAGIAAPQVGVPLRIFIVATRPNARYPNAPFMEPTVFINPLQVFPSPEECLDWEGCLSIPGLRGKVSRHLVLDARWVDRNGICRSAVFKDFPARVYQHENNHLDGVMFTDLARPETFVTDQEYLRIIANKT
jgi:peptide deformylase